MDRSRHPIFSALAYTSPAMLPAVPKSLLVLVVLALIPLGVSAQLACCAGMSSMGSMDMAKSMDMDGHDPGCGDGMTCCEKAHDDALAHHCCEGDSLDRLHSLPRVFAVAPVVLAAAPVLSERAPACLGWPSLPTARPPDLVTLHAAFLI